MFTMAKTKIETKKVYTLIKQLTPISAQKLTAFQGTVPPHNSLETSRNICDVLCNLAPFVEFKKREKHPWRSDTFSKVAGFSNVIKSITPTWVFFTLFKLYKWYLNCAKRLIWFSISRGDKKETLI